MRALLTIVLAALCLAMLAVPTLKAARLAYAKATVLVAVESDGQCPEAQSVAAPQIKTCGRVANAVSTLCHPLQAVLPNSPTLPDCRRTVPRIWVSDDTPPVDLLRTTFRPPRLA